MMTMQAKVVGSTLLAISIAIAGVSFRAISDLTTAVLAAFLKDGAGSGSGLVVEAWPDLISPIVFCLSAATVIMFFAGLFVIFGQVTFAKKPRKALEDLA